MITTHDKLPLAGSAGNRRVASRLYDQFGLRTRMLVPQVPQEVNKAHVFWQMHFPDATQHPQRGLA